MSTNIENLEREISELRFQLARKERELEQIQSSCDHKWGPVKDCSEHIAAYTIPGDPPGTMGSDWRGPVHVPAKTIRRWSKTCLKCGKEITTTRQKEKKSYQPDFG